MHDGTHCAADWVALGHVVRAHGTGGALRLRLYAGLDELLSVPTTLVLAPGHGRAPAHFAVQALRQVGEGFALVHLEGLTDPAMAGAFRGAQVQVAKKLVPPLGDKETYLFELLGRQIYDVSSNRHLGEVQRLYDHGAGPLLGILPAAAPQPAPVPAAAAAPRSARRGRRRPKADKKARQELLLPLMPGVLQEVDLAQGRVLVRLEALPYAWDALATP